ncbi:hypothetical protein BH09MYX1_BH09MYX1_00090 [soil metagenome]
MSSESVNAGVERASAQLAGLYRSELAAVQTYDVALCHASLAKYAEDLRKQKHLHEARVAALLQRLHDVGTPVPASSGAWGTFARLVEEAAASFSPEMALAVLEEEEDTLARDYTGALDVLDPSSKALVADQLLPAQTATHGAVRRMHEIAGA